MTWLYMCQRLFLNFDNLVTAYSFPKHLSRRQADCGQEMSVR